jgi:hypothetical protein
VATELRITVRGDRDVIRALNALPREAQEEARQGSDKLAELLMRKMRGRASSNPQARAAARTLRVAHDRFPTVEAGPEKRLMGSEFGAKARFGWYNRVRFWDSPARQYRPRAVSYWFFVTIDRESAAIDRAHRDMVDDIVRRWSA